MTADRLEQGERVLPEPDAAALRPADLPGADPEAPTDPHLPACLPGPPPLLRPLLSAEPAPQAPAQPARRAQQPAQPGPAPEQPEPAPEQPEPQPERPGPAPEQPEPAPAPPEPQPERPAAQSSLTQLGAQPDGTGAAIGTRAPRYPDSPAWRAAWSGLPSVPDFDDPGPATLPLPAIDLADFEASSAVGRDRDLPASADQTGLAAVARGGTLNLAGALFAAVGTLALTIIVTKHFHKPVAGAFFTAMSLFLMVEAIANLGAYNGAIYFIARLRALHAERRIPAILRATIIPVVLSSLAAAATLIVFAAPLARLLLGDHPAQDVSPAAVASAVRALALALPFAALADTLLGAARGYREMRPTVVLDRIGRSALQLAGVLAAALAASAAWLAPLWALPYLPVSVLALFWLRRIRRRIGRSAASTAPAVAQRHRPAGPAANPVADNRHGKPNARGFWRFTAPRSLASVAQIVIQRLDIVLVAHFKGFAAAAVYTAATRFLVAGQLGNSAISMAAQPQFTHLFAIRDRHGANAVYQATTAWLILLTWPLYLLTVVFGPTVLTIFGRQYQAGSTVMVILGLTMLVATGCGQVDMVLITTGRSSWSLINGLLAMVVNIGIDLALIPRLGITGAAIGWAAAIALTNLMPLVQVAVAARVHPFGSGTAAATLLAALSFGIVPWVLHRLVLYELAVHHLAGAGAALTIGEPVAVGCLVMAAGLWLLRDVLQLSVMPGLASLRRRSAEPGGDSAGQTRRDRRPPG